MVCDGLLSVLAVCNRGSATAASSGQALGHVHNVRTASSWNDWSLSAVAAATADRASLPPAATKACSAAFRFSGSALWINDRSDGTHFVPTRPLSVTRTFSM